MRGLLRLWRPSRCRGRWLFLGERFFDSFLEVACLIVGEPAAGSLDLQFALVALRVPYQRVDAFPAGHSSDVLGRSHLLVVDSAVTRVIVARALN